MITSTITHRRGCFFIAFIFTSCKMPCWNGTNIVE